MAEIVDEEAHLLSTSSPEPRRSRPWLLAVAVLAAASLALSAVAGNATARRPARPRAQLVSYAGEGDQIVIYESLEEFQKQWHAAFPEEFVEEWEEAVADVQGAWDKIFPGLCPDDAADDGKVCVPLDRDEWHKGWDLAFPGDLFTPGDTDEKAFFPGDLFTPGTDETFLPGDMFGPGSSDAFEKWDAHWSEVEVEIESALDGLLGDLFGSGEDGGLLDGLLGGLFGDALDADVNGLGDEGTFQSNGDGGKLPGLIDEKDGTFPDLLDVKKDDSSEFDLIDVDSGGPKVELLNDDNNDLLPVKPGESKGESEEKDDGSGGGLVPLLTDDGEDSPDVPLLTDDGEESGPDVPLLTDDGESGEGGDNTDESGGNDDGGDNTDEASVTPDDNGGANGGGELPDSNDDGASQPGTNGGSSGAAPVVKGPGYGQTQPVGPGADAGFKPVITAGPDLGELTQPDPGREFVRLPGSVF